MTALLCHDLCDPLGEHIRDAYRMAKHFETPFNYWLLEDAIPGDICEDIVHLPFAPPKNSIFDGRRESNNSTRVYFNPENQKKFRIFRELVDVYRDPKTISLLEDISGARLSDGQLRIEYCQDGDGFWLEPHLDISVKLITMLVYLSNEPELADAGTDIYDATPEHNRVVTSPFGRGKGLIFVPGHNSWHGFTQRPIRGIRKSIIINYVTPAWKNIQELA